MTARAPLCPLGDLLVFLFTVDELHRLVAAHYPHLTAELNTKASPRDYVETFVGLLRRHGEIDNTLFAALTDQRPKQAARIAKLAARVLTAEVQDAAITTPFDAEIDELVVRIAALVDEGIDPQRERAELLDLRRLRRAYPEPRRGMRLFGNRYTLLEKIGHGGFASVWRTADRSQQQRVALKILHSHCATSELHRQRFIRGMRVMRTLSHSGILQVYEPEIVSDGFVFAALELISGGDLSQAYTRGLLRPNDVWMILLAVSDALSEAHARGLVHRDIKPSNILLTDAGAPRLTDFDLVLDLETTGGTRTGALGIVLFSAPELWTDARAATPSADVYSLAMTAVFAHVGDPSPLVLRDMKGTLDEMGLTTSLRDVVQRALDWDPKLRFANAREFSDALQLALRQPAPAADPDDPLTGHDILYWVADERGHAETIWLTNDRGRARVVDRTPGVVLVNGERIWVVSHELRQIAGGDFFEGESDVYQVCTIEVAAADLIEFEGSRRIPLGIFTERGEASVPNGEATENNLAILDHSVLTSFSAGPYLFVSSNLFVLWHEAAHGHTSVDFEIYDLRTGESCALFDEAEGRAVTAAYADKVRAKFEREHPDLWEDEDCENDPPVFTMCTAHYDIDAKLQVEYQFSRDVCHAESDQLWSDDTASVRVAADELPAALSDYGSAPRLLRAYWQVAPHYAGSRGWTSTRRALSIRERLRRCFVTLQRGGDGSAPE